ncbi:MAG: maleylpyruvate isomerase family mycothiol-dependent enzyme [Mycobacteriaceae bacterium]|nr:maleylpyruvate isomerase family mycothiol-dependent enzyme [Mycobacteriaceae bacterium]
MDYSAGLLAQNHLFAELLRNADPSTPIPTCPGWTLKHLLRHVGRGDRWAAQIIDQRLTDYLDPRTVLNGKPPDDADGAVEWLHGGAQRVVEAVGRVGGDAEVWTFLGPRPAKWWLRRRLHEVTVHRADAALALDTEFGLSPELASDGLTEWLERVVVQATEEPLPLAGGQTLHLHADDDGDWTLRGNGRGVTMAAARPEDADTTVTGPAAALLLTAVRRLAADDPQITVGGDTDVWRRWLDHTPF